MFFYFYLRRGYVWLNAQIWRRIQRIAYLPGVPIKGRGFLRNSRKLRRSRFSSEPDHCLQSTPIVPQPRSNIRSRALVALGSPDRFINATVDHGFVNNVASKNLWAILRLPKAPNSSAVCHHRDRGVRPTAIGTEWCALGMEGRLVLERGPPKGKRLARVDSLKDYNVGICGRTLLLRGEYGR